MHRTLIVIANASIARLFDRDADNGGLVTVATLQHVESRLPGRGLADDRPGHEATDRGGSHGLQPRHDVRRLEHTKFAHDIAATLRHRFAGNEFQALWLVASNPFLGELRAAMDPPVLATVRITQASDLTSFGLLEIEERLRALHDAQHPRHTAQP